MKRVDSTFLQIRLLSQDSHNRTCIKKQSKGARLQLPELLLRQVTVMSMSYPGAASAMKMPLCDAMAAVGTSTANAVFGKATMSLTWRTTTPLGIVLLASSGDCSHHWQKKRWTPPIWPTPSSPALQVDLQPKRVMFWTVKGCAVS